MMLNDHNFKNGGCAEVFHGIVPELVFTSFRCLFSQILLVLDWIHRINVEAKEGSVQQMVGVILGW
jgi:hypothetical protein